MMLDLHRLLTASLPVAESTPATTTGVPSRGWTLRRDRLTASLVRFDWIHGTGNLHHGNTEDREALRADVLAAASRAAKDAGYRVKPDGIGLTIAMARTRADDRT